MSEENNNEELVSEIVEAKDDLSLEDKLEVEEVLPEKVETVKISEAKPTTNNIITNEKQNISNGDGSVAGITSVANGVIGTGKVARKPKVEVASSKPKVEKVAIHSTKNVTWSTVGKVYKGYNLVTPEQAEAWLSRSHIRTATPEEVAREFGK